jgi:hypothetical protein
VETITLHAKLEAKCTDGMGYTNYVFKDLEYTNYDYQYIMCVRFPNWEQTTFDIGDEGFVTIRYVQEGVDKWFNGEGFNTYKYTNIIFLKFIHLKPETKQPEIIVD